MITMMGGALLEVMFFDSQSFCVPRIRAKLAFMQSTARCLAAVRSQSCS